MLGVPAVVQQAQGQNNNNTLRFNPVCKYHIAAQKPEVLPKVLTVMNSIRGNPNAPEHANTRQFFNLNANGSRAVVLRRYSQNQSLCDFRRACNLIDDKQICYADAVFDKWPLPADVANRLRLLVDSIVYPSKFNDVVTSQARADGFYAQALSILKEDAKEENMDLLPQIVERELLENQA